MDLSIVIVNYNVKHFLEQCLHSVYKASRLCESEVFVVDNNSVDGSSSMIREKFPWVKLIENKKNLGFSTANNQALRIASGKYRVLLNPDTLVEENTFLKCISFMNEHPDAGALGVKMIDGKGNFLPESKRALPTPSVAFFKVFGLARLFPKSKIFGQYHLGYLDKEQTHSVEVLSGAFMFLRAEALDKTGLLDEDFFMYGEDIDLSYRMLKNGFKNYYFPETTIIHYKGESTKKGSINYVLVFYNAMLIFARKHFTRNNIRVFVLLISLAIYFRAGLSVGRRFVRKLYQPLVDFLLLFTSYWFLIPLWGNYKFGFSGDYPDDLFHFIVPAYLFIWIASIYLSGGYERPVKLWSVTVGFLSGTIVILVLYALLPEGYRFSRALILLGSLWGILLLIIYRLVLYLVGFPDYELSLNRKKKILIIGQKTEALRVSEILKKTQILPHISGFISPTGSSDPEFLGNTSQITEIIRIHQIEEIVFCAKDISSREIIRVMTEITDKGVGYKIASPESQSIIGSNSISTAGDIYLINFNSISGAGNKRNKLMLDFGLSLFFFISWPFLFPFFKAYRKNFSNAIRVLLMARSWVGYSEDRNTKDLPVIKKGVFSPCSQFPETSAETKDYLNMEYARDYKVYNDFSIFMKNIFDPSVPA